MAGWLDQLRLKLTQSPTGVGVEVGTELGSMIFSRYTFGFIKIFRPHGTNIQ